MEEALK